MRAEDAYADMIKCWREAGVLQSCAAVLEWEQQTTMPSHAAEHRSEQLSLLAGMHHERVTDPRLGDLLREVEDSSIAKDRLSVEAVNVREIRRSYDKATKLPRTLVEEMAKTFSFAQQEWAAARREKNFARFQPWLAKAMDLTRQKAKAINPTGNLYDTLMDDYEPGAKGDEIAKVFEQLREALVPFVAAIQNSPRQPKGEIIERTYPIDRQQYFGEMVASEIGFDFARGRLDTTTHPFCTTLGPHDCRILTRYNPRFFNESFFGILHEAGHGLYEQGLEPEHYGTPMGEAVSLGIHESQSRHWENSVGRSRSFWQHYYPKARGTFRDALGTVPLDDFYFAVNKVAPSFIRVEADEVTYNLHVMIRFELERALISEDLSVEGLPAAWNDKYQKYLGILPPDDAMGCLQDVHWSAGLIGYFPTYTLGNIYCAQFFDTADRDLAGINALIARGEFSELLAWLRYKIHRHGKRFLPVDLVREVTGSDPSHEPLVRQLHAKFDELYGL